MQRNEANEKKCGKEIYFLKIDELSDLVHSNN